MEMPKFNANQDTLYIFGFENTLFDVKSIEKEFEDARHKAIKEIQEAEDKQKRDLFKGTFDKRLHRLTFPPGWTITDIYNVKRYQMFGNLIFRTLKKLNFPKIDGLKEVLDELRGDKWIFSNGNGASIKTLLAKGDLKDCFHVIFSRCFDSPNMVEKPGTIAFVEVDKVCQSKLYKTIYYFDKNQKNVEMASKFGWISKKSTPQTIVNDLKEIKAMRSQ